MAELLQFLAGMILTAGCTFAGYWHGRRVEQELWTSILLGETRVVVLRAARLSEALPDSLDVLREAHFGKSEAGE